MDERMSSGEMTSPEGMHSVLILDDKDAKKRKFLAADAASIAAHACP
jgi:hypothetical protein